MQLSCWLALQIGGLAGGVSIATDWTISLLTHCMFVPDVVVPAIVDALAVGVPIICFSIEAQVVARISGVIA
jgi:hypothetical protein